MEYCSGGDLHDFADHWLYTRAQNIPEMFLLHFIASMGEALGYLHLGLRHRPAEDGVNMPTVIQEEDHLPLLHRDIKLDNIFLRWSRTSYGMPEIVLGDFGGASLASRAVGMFGTPGYFPPEVRTYMHSPGIPSSAGAMSTASDIYTVAACLCYLLVWGSYAPERDMVPIFNSSSLRGWPLLLDLLQDCLKKDPEDRPDTMTLFDWAPVLQNRIQFLYEHNVRMPGGSWLQPKVVAATVSVDAVPRRSLAIPESIYTATTPSADAWEFDDREVARSISTLKGRTDRPAIQAVGKQPAVEQVRTRPPTQRVWSWTFRGRGEREMARSFSSANPTDSWVEAQRAWVDQLPRSPSTPTTRNNWPDNQPGNIVPIQATRELGSTHPSSPARLKHLWLGGLGVVPALAPSTHPSSSARVNDLWLPGLGIVPARAPPTQDHEHTHPSSSANVNDLWLSGLGVVPTRASPESMHPSPPPKMNDLWLPGLGVVPGRDSANSRPGIQPSKQRSLYSPKNSRDDKHVVQGAKAFDFRVLPLRPRRVTIRRPPPASRRSDVVERMASVVSRLSPRRSRRAVPVSRVFADSDIE
ncbi:kinase-like domain-containing protein [Neohortaea acidophila]|uniref:non-specific serine/threonine protein kinase n=1 Tax=Neohortaea acidophila TaxID=245834 RepID=A0A6A6PXT4_9PEZI|nr:kinase-like domain-containing protein [Neohortaea acidophila]KAF2484561.1 kinase-like domain-containing protein [Neohortaea acidophila]